MWPPFGKELLVLLTEFPLCNILCICNIYFFQDRGSTDDLLLLQIACGVVWQSRDLHEFFIVLNRDLFVYRVDSLIYY